MKNTLFFEKIMVALDLSNVDEKLISYSRFMAKNTSTKSLRFIHVIPHFFIPEAINASFEEMIRGEESLEQRIRRKLAKEIQPTDDGDNGLKTEVEVATGH